MYDCIIIGGGPAGISASLYTKRANLSTLVIYKEETSLGKAEKIENYYGFENGINGKDLYTIGLSQAKNIGVELENNEVVKIEIAENGFRVVTTKNEYSSKAVILATGNKKNKPKIKGIEEFEGKGISYCAICDGFFYRGKDVAVIGSGEYAISETNDLLGIAKNITILTNGNEVPEFRAENVSTNSNELQEIQGEKKVEAVKFIDDSKLRVDGIFIAEGTAGSTEFARKLGAIVKDDKIIVNEKMETNIKGIYACGDCTGGILQVSKAVYEGTVAGLQAIEYVRKNKQSF